MKELQLQDASETWGTCLEQVKRTWEHLLSAGRLIPQISVSQSRHINILAPNIKSHGTVQIPTILLSTHSEQLNPVAQSLWNTDLEIPKCRGDYYLNVKSLKSQPNQDT